jgi:hypothetical protein
MVKLKMKSNYRFQKVKSAISLLKLSERMLILAIVCLHIMVYWYSRGSSVYFCCLPLVIHCVGSNTISDDMKRLQKWSYFLLSFPPFRRVQPGEYLL